MLLVVNDLGVGIHWCTLWSTSVPVLNAVMRLDLCDLGLEKPIGNFLLLKEEKVF